MNFRKLILRSLVFHARSHFGVIVGAAVGGAVLVGALIVGDSVRATLKNMALSRLGAVDYAMVTGDRLFRDQLADDLASEHRKTAPILLLPGTASDGENSVRANRVQIVGVDARFWSLANENPVIADLTDDEVVLSESLARQLAAREGKEVVLRVPRLSSLSRDAPMAPQEGTSAGLRLTVKKIVTDAQFGRFSLQANQVPPFNAFVSLKRLQDRVEAKGRSNVLLVDSLADELPDGVISTALRSAWKLADADLQLVELPNGRGVELRSPRVFLDPPVVKVAKLIPEARLIQTYFVNELRTTNGFAPYSMVTAAGAPFVPDDLKDDEIIVTENLNEDIKAQPGDRLEMTYFVVGLGRKLTEHTNTFRVHSIVPLTGVYDDRELMPAFPGMTDAESCRDWDAGFNIDQNRLRPKDQTYWNERKGTPKAYVTANAGTQMWANRFGDFTAVRFGIANETSASARQLEIEKSLLSTLDPGAIGFTFQPVRAQALAAGKGSQDFGGLFFGFSLFLIVAALILVSMLFQFSIEQRSTEVGTLLAVGFTPRQVRGLLLGEGVGLAAIGSAIGLAGAVYYANGMLHALGTVWRDAVGTGEIAFHAGSATLVGGYFGSIGIAAFSIWLALRKQVQQPARELLAGEDSGTVDLSARISNARRNLVTGTISFLAAIGLVGFAFQAEDMAAAGSFFGAGALLLIAALCFTSLLLSRLEQTQSSSTPSLSGLGIRNATRRRKRSLATVAMLACGSFLVLSIGVFRLEENSDTNRRDFGTGGFALIGEATIPVVQDLNTKAGREFFGLDEKDLPGVSFVPMKLREGDDASCLNLNRAQRPRILAVNPTLMTERKAFAFAKLDKSVSSDTPWEALRSSADGDDAIPAIADNASIMWAMGKSVGDILEYPDLDERGQPVRFRLVGGLANSILQGSLLIDEENFARRFPTESGYRYFLMDVPADGLTNVTATLSRAFRDNGLELTPTTRRLAQFNAVQNTYLGTFQILGGLGLLLGSAGLGVVVLRNVLERRSELALLLAVGFRASSLKWLVLSEHVALLLLGLFSGIGAAVVAVVPAIRGPVTDLPYDKLILTLAGVLLSGIIWTWLASLWAIRGKIIDALRNE